MKLMLFLALLFSARLLLADDVEKRLETNINDRMQNETPQDQIKIKGISDASITRQIKDTLKNSALSNFAKNIEVISARGHVTLKGRILSQDEESLILQKVRSVAGVTMVLNEMQTIPNK